MIIIRLLLLLVPVATELFKTDFTAGNTRCRHDNKCGFHQRTRYSWCYTNYSGGWGYCCTDYCRLHPRDYYWCPSGNWVEHCGGYQTKDVSGRPCLEDHVCGMHYEEGENGSYWCYVDLNGNWGYCCAVLSPCDYRGKSYTWCYISGYTTHPFWQYCKKDE
ncbi:hypothetical protein ACJMK2_021523 [Sinanodonta woodiana]|uniref:Uncharacterized protein n=1 Tax=Sinanodonta woodiana TaxID=1069815 RepID=A0ABD3THA0_SINWO